MRFLKVINQDEGDTVVEKASYFIVSSTNIGHFIEIDKVTRALSIDFDVLSMLLTLNRYLPN